MLVIQSGLCLTAGVKMKNRHERSMPVRLWPEAATMVTGWVTLTGFSASKVASSLILEAGQQKAGACVQRLEAEARAKKIISLAQQQARAIRLAKGGHHDWKR